MRAIIEREGWRKAGRVLSALALTTAGVALGVPSALPAHAASCPTTAVAQSGSFAEMSQTGSITGTKVIGPVTFTVTVTPDWQPPLPPPPAVPPPDLNSTPTRRFAGVAVANNPGPPRFESRGPTNHVVIETSEPVTDLAVTVSFFGTTRNERMRNFSLVPTAVTGQGSLDASQVVVPTNVDGTVVLNWSPGVQRIAFDWTSDSGGASVVGTTVSYATGVCDMGDAPAGYGSAHAAAATSALTLGAGFTADAADLFSSDATADVDDALATPLRSLSGNADAAYSLTVPVTNTTPYPAVLQGWIDLDRDGTFDPGEAASVDIPAGATSGVLTWSGERAAGQSFVRLRLHQNPVGSVGPTDVSVGGEVEDYAVEINAVPVITDPPAGTVTNDNTPSISGAATPGNSITVRDSNSQIVCTVDQVPATGVWSCTSSPLADGSYSLVPVATAADGVVSTGVPVEIRIDTVAPVAPVIVSPAGGSILNTATPTITMTGEPGSSITVVDENSRTLCSTVVAADGQASCTSVALADGAHSLTPTAMDAAGNETTGTPVAITVDTASPTAPVIVSPAAGSILNTATPTITMTGEPGSSITVVDENSRTLCSTVVAADGQASCTSAALADGAHSLTPTAMDAAGNETTGTPVAITVDTASPTAPVIVSPAAGSILNTATPTITMTGEPGSSITVVDENSRTLCSTVVAADGQASCTSAALADGAHSITPTTTDAAGNEVTGVSVVIRIDTVAPQAPVIVSPAAGSILSTATPTITMTGEPGSSITVVDENSRTLCSTVVAADGSASCTSAALADGAHSITPTATDAAGNEVTGVSVVIRIDTVAPQAPVIVSPAAGSILSTATPIITMTGEPGSSITVVDENSRTLCSTVVAADGSASCTSAALADGSHSLTPTATDAAGNATPGTAINITVSTNPTPPAAKVTYWISPSTGPPGTVIKFNGSGCAPSNLGPSGTDGAFAFVKAPHGSWSQQIQVNFQSAADGTFRGSLRIPSWVSSGLYSTGVMCYGDGKAGWPKAPTYRQFRVCHVMIASENYDTLGREAAIAG